MVKRILGAVGGACRCAAELSNSKRLFAAGVFIVNLDRFIPLANGSVPIGFVGNGSWFALEVCCESKVFSYPIT